MESGQQRGDPPLERKQQLELVYCWELCNRRWVKLLCACRMSFEVTKNADGEESNKQAESYWYHGRRWEECMKYDWGNSNESHGN